MIVRMSFYNGDIMTKKEGESVVLKRNAILYKNINGMYADISNINNVAEYKKIDKVPNDRRSTTISKRITVMPGVSLDALEIPELYVDEDSLSVFSSNEILHGKKPLIKKDKVIYK